MTTAAPSIDTLERARAQLARVILDLDAPNLRPIYDRLTREIDAARGDQDFMEELRRAAG